MNSKKESARCRRKPRFKRGGTVFLARGQGARRASCCGSAKKGFERAVRRASGTPPGQGLQRRADRADAENRCVDAVAAQSILRQTSSRRVRLERPGRAEAPDASVAANSSIPAHAGKRLAEHWKQSRTHCSGSLRRGGIFSGCLCKKPIAPIYCAAGGSPRMDTLENWSGRERSSQAGSCTVPRIRLAFVVSAVRSTANSGAPSGRARLPAPLP